MKSLPSQELHAENFTCSQPSPTFGETNRLESKASLSLNRQKTRSALPWIFILTIKIRLALEGSRQVAWLANLRESRASSLLPEVDEY
jgi:hypothetical protein